jgi:hypothetical protein
MGQFLRGNGGAAAALAGLIIVAMSVNIQTIIGIPSMTSRAAATIASLILIVVSTAAGLIPGQPAELLGAELLVFGVGATVLTVDSAVRMLRAAVRPSVTVIWVKIVVACLQILPFLVGAAVLLTSSYDGL